MASNCSAAFVRLFVVQHPFSALLRVLFVTEDDPLYRTERYFPPRPLFRPGYRIPLNRGSYRVTLHFAEIWYKAAGRRLFDVVLEGERVLELYDPGAAGYATAQSEQCEIAVGDGRLEIEFRPRRENPKISAIEIERLE